MMILKCDRCGKGIDPSTAMIVEICTYKYHRTVVPEHYDLCDECMKRLNNWLNPLEASNKENT